MFINNFDPVAIQIFSIEIKWYSLAYISGILLGWVISKKIFISNQSIKEKHREDYLCIFVSLYLVASTRWCFSPIFCRGASRDLTFFFLN